MVLSLGITQLTVQASGCFVGSNRKTTFAVCIFAKAKKPMIHEIFKSNPIPFPECCVG
jgi:hypothetical protein